MFLGLTAMNCHKMMRTEDRGTALAVTSASVTAEHVMFFLNLFWQHTFIISDIRLYAFEKTKLLIFIVPRKLAPTKGYKCHIGHENRKTVILIYSF